MHCHLIPGVDDGQESVEGATILVAREVQWGIKRIFFTPHVTQDVFENTPATITPAFDLLKKSVENQGIDVKLDFSAEHRLDANFRLIFDNKDFKPLPNNYLLVENSFVQEAWNLDAVLFDMIMKGYNPILAHPERYSFYFAHPERYDQIHAAGTKFQVNLLSLAGYYGKEVKRFAEMLIEKNLVDFIGTDIHNEKHADVIEEYLCGRDYRRHASLLHGRILNDKAL